MNNENVVAFAPLALLLWIGGSSMDIHRHRGVPYPCDKSLTDNGQLTVHRRSHASRILDI